MLEFRILGPLDVVHDGGSLAVGRRRERALLAILLLAANRVVPVDRLAEDLAGDGGPPATPAALRVYLSRLRGALRAAGGPDVLLTHPGGYELRITADAVDAGRFEARAAAARQRLAAGEHEPARRSLDDALALWRGPALLEYQDAPFARATAARLEGARLAAVEDRFEAMLGCGAHREVIGDLEEFTRAHPLRERCWALRMHALYRDGRQAEALRVFQDLRGLLRDELGLEPSAALRALEVALLRQDPDLDLPTGPLGATRPAEAPVVPVGPAEGWERATPGIALPPRLAAPPDIRFVGRSAESTALERAFKEVDAGGGQRLLVVQGEPGMGKTTLCSEFARGVHAAGALVLYGRSEDELGIPYQPFAEALAHYVTHADPALLAAHVAEHGGELAAIVPALRRRVPDVPSPLGTEAESQRYVLFRAVVALLAAAAADRTVVLVIDDLHWADKPTLLLLRYLAGASEPLRLLVIGTYRGSELSRDRPLADTLATLRQEGRDRLELAGLEDGDVFALMETAAGHSLDGAFSALARQLRQDTGGNPFFVVELMRHLGEKGLVRREEGRWEIRGSVDRQGMPASLREVVGARVARLGPRAEQVLTQAAVMGRDFHTRVLGAVCGLPEADLVAELERAATAAIVMDVAPGHYSFVHAAIQSTLYDDLHPTRRAVIHRQIAETLETLDGAGPGPRVAEIAHHWMAATPSPDEHRPGVYARWAGEAALAARAPEEAVRWFSAALGLLGPRPDSRSHAALLIELGTAQRLAGDTAHRETLLEAAALARSVGDADLLVRAALANNRGTLSSTGVVDAERVAALEDALAASPAPSPERARLLATLGAELSCNGDWPKRRALAREATDLARSLGDPETLVRVHNLLYFAVWVPETLTERLATTAESVALAGDSADPAVRHWAHRLHFYACADAGRLDDMDRHLPGLVEGATASGDPGLLWASLFNQQGRALLGGDLDATETLAADAFAVGTAGGMPEAGFSYAVALAAVRTLQDRAGEVVEIYEGAVVQAPGLSFLRSHLARLYCLLGRYDGARALFAPDAADRFRRFEYDWTWMYGIVSYAEVCARLADADAAAVLYSQLQAWHDQVVFFFFDYLGAVALYLGMLATTLERFSDAESHFAEALAIHERLGAPAWVVRTHLETARMLLARRAPGDADRATAALDAAVAIATDRGFAAFVRDAGELRAAPAGG